MKRAEADLAAFAQKNPVRLTRDEQVSGSLERRRCRTERSRLRNYLTVTRPLHDRPCKLHDDAPPSGF
jgi:hypothetical protein